MPNIVAILPGHGGFDPGSINWNYNIKEADGNLSVALKLAYLLEYNNIKPLLSRTKDIACGGATNVRDDINNQIRFANNSGADIAVSIHFNSSTDKSAHGTEVLYTNYPKKNENEIRLANILLEELLNHNGLYNRKIKEISSGVGVIKYINIPCVLSECAFISNDKESIWCSNEEHNWILAEAHTIAICRYFGIKFKNPRKEEIIMDNISDWAKSSVEKVKNSGLMKGKEDGWYPQSGLTREEFAVILDKLGLIDMYIKIKDNK